MWGWLNQNASVVQAIFAVVVGLATVAYVILTRQLVSESRAVRRAEVAPLISVWIEHSPHAPSFFDIVVANLGRGPALDLQFAIEAGGDWEIARSTAGVPLLLREVGVFAHPTPVVAPGQSFRSALGEVKKIGAAGLPDFRISATYRGILEPARTVTFQLATRTFSDSLIVGTPGLLQIARTLHKLEGRLGAIADGLTAGRRHVTGTGEEASAPGRRS